MKFRLYILTALIAAICIVLSCGHDEFDTPIVDYRCVIKVSSGSEKIYANTPSPVVLDIKRNNSQVGSYELTYSIESGKGDILINGEKVNPGDKVPVQLEKLSIHYIPTAIGSHRLKFRFTNEEYFTECAYTTDVNDMVFVATAENLPKKLLIDKNIAFDLNITQKEESESEEFKALLSILKGKGYVKLVSDPSNDTLKLDQTKSPDTKAGGGYKVKVGINKLNYFSSEEGENVILLQIENEYGYLQNINLPLKIELPDFQVKANCDTVGNVGTINNFLLNILDADDFGDNIYNVTYRNLQNSGTLKINGNEIQVGTSIQLQKGDNVCEFIPNQLGETSLEFIVKDKYNSTRKDTAIFNAKRSYVDITVSDYDTLTTVYASKDISFSVSKTNYKGKYYADIAQLSAGLLTLKVNGVNYAGGRIEITNLQNTLISFVPKNIGDIKLRIKVYDDFNSESFVDIPFTVKNSSVNIGISNHNPITNIFSPTSFNFSVSKPNYTNTYQYKILQYQAGLSGNFGSIKVNGVNYAGGRMDVANTSNTTVTFTPKVKGEIKLLLKIYDILGGEMSHELNYSVNNTDIKLSVTDLNKDIILSKVSEFTFTATKPFYESGKLTLVVSQDPLNSGIIKIDDQSYVASGMATITNNTPVKVSFTPLTEGAAKISLKVYDEWGGTAIYPASFNVTNPPIRLETTGFVPTSTINTENSFNFSVSKDNYRSNFKYLISTQPQNAGTIKINDVAYTGGLNTLTDPQNTKLSFFPKVTEDVVLTLTVKDDVNGQVKRSFTYKTENPKLQLLVGALEDNLTLNKRTSFNFSVSKANYTGKFFYDLDAANCSEIRAGNTLPLPGQRYEILTPEGTTISFLPTKVGQNATTLTLKVYDEWGGVTERKLQFSVTNSDIELTTANVETTMFQGRTSPFNFTAKKPAYEGKLKYELQVFPTEMGTFKIEEKDYVSGQIEMTSGSTIPVTFTPLKEGTANLKVIIRDDFGGEKSQSYNLTITTTPIVMEIADFVGNASINTASIFTMSLSKLYYSKGYDLSIVMSPSDGGIIKINGTDYAGGKVPVVDPRNTKISFSPKVTGNISLSLNVSDQIGGKVSKELNFKAVNNPIDVTVSNQQVGLIVNKETNFNFSVNKANYTGKFQFELTSEPVNSGKFKINGADYTGGRMDVANTSNTRVTFTPSQTGDIKLVLKVYDNFGGEINKDLSFAVSNSESKIIVSNQVSDIVYNTPTTFNISVVKENYTGHYKYEIIQEPEFAGKLKVNGTAYTPGKIDLTNPASTPIEFTSTQAGKNVLTFKVYDELDGMTEKNLVFNVTNPELKLEIKNQMQDILVNSTGTFNFNVSKEEYTGSFKAQIEQSPAGMGTILIGGKAYDGTKIVLTQNSNVVSFTPSKTGAVTLNLTVEDEWGLSKTILVPFSVANTDIAVSLEGKEREIVLNSLTSLSFNVTKPSYTGTFKAKIIQDPANSGTIKLNSSVISDENLVIIKATGNTLEFTPSKTGAVLLKLIVTDELNGEKEVPLNFNVTNPELALDVKNHTPDIFVNSASTFNFNVSKPNYSGKFKFQIEQSPAGMGTILIGGKAYDGTKITLTQNSNVVSFTPSKNGAVTLNLTVEDEWGLTKTVPVPFSVSNTDISVFIQNKEQDITLNTQTSLQFTISKSNYTENFKAKIIQDPANSGTIKLNSSVVTDGELIDVPANNTLQFTPSRTGAVLLKLVIMDGLKGEKEVPLNFNVINPKITLDVTNKEASLIFNKATSFNVAITKPNYSGAFTYEITQSPAAAGTLTVDGKSYTGGIAAVANPKNLLVGFTPTTEGFVSLQVSVHDNTGSKTEKNVGFNVANASVNLTLNSSGNNISIGQTATFTMKAEKEGYTGRYTYEIVPYPLDCGTITALGGNNLTGALTQNPGTVTFVPTKTGTTIFNVKVTDETGKSCEKQIYYNTANTPIEIAFVNNESNVILNNPTNFVFKVSKNNYPDSKNITYTISPAYNGTLIVDGKSYTGTSISVPYSKLKNGINVSYSPDREGTKSLTFTAQDEFEGLSQKSVTFNVANPELQLYLTGVNTVAANEATLGSTYKFYYNINKANYNDDFSYWLTLDPQAVGIVGTSDATPRGRSGGGVDMQTGTIKSNPNGVTTGEIRFTPSNADYLNREITVNVRIRDKWNNEKEQTVRFKIVTSAIEINVNRKTSIDVEVPYTFYFTVTKPGYTGSFKYSLVGWADGDKLEVSADNSRWTTYAGGKFELPNKDHTYIRYTPAAINTVPLRLFVYDEQNGEAMQELTFDVKAPEVKLKADATLKTGYLNQYVPFTLTAEEGKGENVNLTFAVDDPTFSGDLKFNNSVIIPASSRARAATSSFNVASGTGNKLEIMAFNKGTWSTTVTATNRWQKSASVTTSVQVDQKPRYTLTTSKTGEGTIDKKASDNTSDPTYESGTIVTLTATPAAGWKFVRWGGDAAGTASTMNITMNNNWNIQAVFEAGITDAFPSGFSTEGEVWVRGVDYDSPDTETSVVYAAPAKTVQLAKASTFKLNSSMVQFWGLSYDNDININFLQNEKIIGSINSRSANKQVFINATGTIKISITMGGMCQLSNNGGEYMTIGFNIPKGCLTYE